MSDTFAYRSHRKKPVSTLRVSTSLKRKAILRVSRTCVQNKTYKLKGSIINQTEEVILLKNNRELKQARRRQQQKPHKFAYLTMKNTIFAGFARAFFPSFRSRTF